MLTQCPHCQTTFRVTSEILRVADGQVRCGRCQTQFDGFERLIDENDATAHIESGRFLRPGRAPSEPAPDDDLDVEEPLAHEEITLEGRRIEISGAYERLGADDEPQIREEVTEEWVEIDDVDEAVATSNEHAGVEEIVLEGPREAASEPEIEPAPSRPAPAPSNAPPPARKPWHEPAPTERHEEPSVDLDLAPATSSRRSRAWAWLALPLAALLALQLIHHYRSALARHPRVGKPLMSAYERLGLQLTPDWNLHGYQIRQWGVVSDPARPGTLRVRATITNLANFAQPYPLLKLVLENRWGEQVGAREFEPAEYLDPAAAPERLLAPAQKANATIVIVDPGPDAEGFRFDVCLRGRRGAVCAGDVPGGG